MRFDKAAVRVHRQTSKQFHHRSAVVIELCARRYQPLYPLREKIIESFSRPHGGGIISLRELKHSVKKEAFKRVAEAQRYADKNEPSKAFAKLEEAVRIDPEYRDAHTNLGVAYARTGNAEEAMQHFRRALEIGPPDVIIYSNLSWACLAQRQFSEAEEFGRKAIALDARNAKAHLVLGNALAMQPGKEAEAMTQLQLASPEEPRALALIELVRTRYAQRR